MRKYQKQLRVTSILLLLLSGVGLIGLQIKSEGWFLLGLSFASLLVTDKKFAKDFLLINISIIFLGILDISTNISYKHIVQSGVLISLAVAVPYVISRYFYKDDKIRFSFGNMRGWNKNHYLYILLAAAVSYFLIPFYLHNTDAYLNWPSQTDLSSVIRLFLGTNGLGIWDELFFIIVVLGVFKHYMKFMWANIAQAILWTSFLYELGFTGWGPIFIFFFALLQGYIFQKTHSLLYTLSIHLALDLVLFLAIVNAHNSTWFNIFIT